MTTFNKAVWHDIKGFMSEAEADHLYQTALTASTMGPVLEVGSYCGKSAYVLGSACKKTGSILYSIDHHQGSEEQQPGEEYYDPVLFDETLGRINTFPFFQQTLAQTSLEDIVIPVLGSSGKIGTFWNTSLSMVFVDGGHSYDAALEDYHTWADHVMPDGFLVFHDIFFDPEKGGQAPRKVYEIARDSDQFEQVAFIETLGVLKRR